jgi:adenylylsulfate kinase
VSSAIWITGPPASGKSVLARAAAAALHASGEPVVVLELDEIREVVTPAPTYTDTERDVVYRALVYMAAALTAAGARVIIDATAHRRAWRDLARRRIPRFAEVQLVCPLDVCRKREIERAAGHAPRGIYARAGAPGSVVPGVDVPYEPALRPELTIETHREDRDAAVQRVVALVRALGESLERRAVDRRAAWAIWVTGLPGSGKTTLARNAAESLAARATRVQVLEFAEFRQALLGDGPESDGTREIVYRALAYTAKLLTEAGVPVIVDATAPRRAWRRLARRLITHFAEVQLVCPYEICGDRERAVRWHLGSEPPASCAQHAAPQPDMVLGYEGSLDPELALHTDTPSLAANVEALLRLALRLQHAAATAGFAPKRPIVS